MKASRTAIAVLALAGLLVLTSCASTTGTAAPRPITSVSEDSSEAPAPMQTPDQATSSATPEAAEPMAGAYLDYTDGAIEATAGPKALFFHAPWCPKCRALDEDLQSSGPPDGLTIFKVDYDSRGDLRQKYGVTLQTTIVFLDDAGEVLSSVVLYDDPSVDSLVAAIP